MLLCCVAAAAAAQLDAGIPQDVAVGCLWSWDWDCCCCSCFASQLVDVLCQRGCCCCCCCWCYSVVLLILCLMCILVLVLGLALDQRCAATDNRRWHCAAFTVTGRGRVAASVAAVAVVVADSVAVRVAVAAAGAGTERGPHAVPVAYLCLGVNVIDYIVPRAADRARTIRDAFDIALYCGQFVQFDGTSLQIHEFVKSEIDRRQSVFPWQTDAVVAIVAVVQVVGYAAGTMNSRISHCSHFICCFLCSSLLFP